MADLAVRGHIRGDAGAEDVAGRGWCGWRGPRGAPPRTGSGRDVHDAAGSGGSSRSARPALRPLPPASGSSTSAGLLRARARARGPAPRARSSACRSSELAVQLRLGRVLAPALPQPPLAGVQLGIAAARRAPARPDPGALPRPRRSRARPPPPAARAEARGLSPTISGSASHLLDCSVVYPVALRLLGLPAAHAERRETQEEGQEEGMESGVSHDEIPRNAGAIPPGGSNAGKCRPGRLGTRGEAVDIHRRSPGRTPRPLGGRLSGRLRGRTG